eukprot:1146721-Pelagomonas_calceolata.AAC.5
MSQAAQRTGFTSAILWICTVSSSEGVHCFNMHPAGTTNLASHMLGPERVSDPGTTSAHLQQCYHEMPDFQHPSRGSISYPGSEIGWEGGIGSGGSLRDAYHTAGPQKVRTLCNAGKNESSLCEIDKN